ncbi:MAG: 4Fe-4S cluster-binding domain-containing protein [Ruminococcus flavefaciens]|nr:4Fe-4S cluster-binding domain-containing protein [Ruminococcus flavefaciens]
MNTKKIFIPEYYELIDMMGKETKATDLHATFRERDIKSIYNGIAIEIVQEELCQLSCEWCYINQCKKEKLNKPLDFMKFKIIVDKINDYNKHYNVKLFSNIIFIGGEPTINTELDKMIEYSLKSDLTPIIVTNGVKLVDMEYARKICLDGVKITIHLPLFGDSGEDILDKATHKGGYSQELKQAITNLLYLKEEGRSIEIVGELVVCQTTKMYAYDSYVYCRTNGIVPFLEFMRISNDSYTNKHLLLNRSDICELGNKLYTYDLEHGFITDDVCNKVRYFLPPAVNSPCTLIQNSIHIKYEKDGFGKVISCCGQSINHGNIMVDSLEDILEHKKNTKIFSEQKAYIKGPCSVCKLYDLTGCEGGCRGNAKNTFDCAEASDPQCIFIAPEVSKNKEIMTLERQYLIKEDI